jgi:hypothetical protein
MLQKCKIDCHLARGVAHVELMDPIGKLNISSLIQSPFMKMQMKLFCAINFPVTILFGTICFKSFFRKCIGESPAVTKNYFLAMFCFEI